jgi:uncharacterized protein YeaO (DUF488 family)
MIQVVCLYDQRPKGERIRVGAVRYQRRGWTKEEIAELYDVWLPELAPSRELRRRRTKDTMDRDTYLRRFRSQMGKPEGRHLIALLAGLSKVTSLSVGCYCQEETTCHRQVLRELLVEAGAELA